MGAQVPTAVTENSRQVSNYTCWALLGLQLSFFGVRGAVSRVFPRARWLAYQKSECHVKYGPWATIGLPDSGAESKKQAAVGRKLCSDHTVTKPAEVGV